MKTKIIKKFIPKKIKTFLIRDFPKLYIKKYKKTFHPLIVRKNTSDIHCFRQVFIQKDYNIKLKNKPKTIIDLGANVGYASMYFSKKYPNSKIISVEPEIKNYEIMKKNCSQFKNVFPIHAGIWSKKANLKIVDDGSGEWGLKTTEVKNKKDADVSAISIDSIIKEHKIKKIDILKIDIEGAEENLFSKNYKKWLSITDTIIIELHEWMKRGTSKNFWEAIKGYDFKISKRGENLILRK